MTDEYWARVVKRVVKLAPHRVEEGGATDNTIMEPCPGCPDYVRLRDLLRRVLEERCFGHPVIDPDLWCDIRRELEKGGDAQWDHAQTRNAYSVEDGMSDDAPSVEPMDRVGNEPALEPLPTGQPEGRILSREEYVWEIDTHDLPSVNRQTLLDHDEALRAERDKFEKMFRDSVATGAELCIQRDHWRELRPRSNVESVKDQVRDYWIDQLVMEVKRLRAIPDEVRHDWVSSGSATTLSPNLSDYDAGRDSGLAEVKRRMEGG